MWRHTAYRLELLEKFLALFAETVHVSVALRRYSLQGGDLPPRKQRQKNLRARWCGHKHENKKIEGGDGGWGTGKGGGGEGKGGVLVCCLPCQLTNDHAYTFRNRAEGGKKTWC